MPEVKLVAFVGSTAVGGITDITDPRYYGAVGDGVADDSAAISSAIATGGLTIPAPYVFGYTWAGISAALGAVADGFRVTGYGTIKLLSGSTPALEFTATTIIYLLDFTVDGNGQTGTEPVIKLSGSNLNMRGLYVKGGGTNPNFALVSPANIYSYTASGCVGIKNNVHL